MLVHHADAGPDGGSGSARRKFAPEGQHAAGICPLMAEQDVHQRGLAGPVLAQQGQDLALAQLERHVSVGDQHAEMLGDPLEAQDRCRHAASPATVAA